MRFHDTPRAWSGGVLVLWVWLCAGLVSVSHGADLLELPPGLSRESVGVMEGEARDRAGQALDEVLEAVSIPGFLVDDGLTSMPGSPSRSAQRAYVLGREAWLDGRAVDAIPRLLTATRLAPREPAFSELLARVYAGSGSTSAAQRYARAAVDAQPERVSALLLLLRLSAESTDHEQTLAIAKRLRSLVEGPEGDPAVRIILSRLLGQTLLKMQRPVAAREALEDYLYPPDLPARASAQDNLARTLMLSAPLVWREIGDGALRLGDPVSALEAYEQSGSLPERLGGQRHAREMLLRQVWVDLVVDRPERARQRVVDAFSVEGDDRDLLELAAYLFRVGAGDEALLDRLRLAYERSRESAEMVIALAGALPAESGRRLLVDHMRSAPGALEVLSYLVTEVLLPEGASESREADLELATRLTVDAVLFGGVSPQEALAWVSDSQQERAAVSSQFARLGWERPEAESMSLLLQGLLLATLPGRSSEAEESLRASLEVSAERTEARVALVNLLIGRGRLDEAEAALGRENPLGDASLATATARLLLRHGQGEAALDLLTDASARWPESVDLALIEGEVLHSLGRTQASEEALLRGLDIDANDERLYRALFSVYERQNGDAQAGQKWVNLMRRVLAVLPESVTARVKLAQWHATRRQLDRAEAILDDLLIQRPDDPLAMRAMLDLLAQQDRDEDGHVLIQERLAVAPDDLSLLQNAIRFYRQSQQRERLIDVTERMLKLSPEGRERTLSLLQFYVQSGKIAAMERLLQSEADRDELVPLGYGLLLRQLMQQEREDETERVALRGAELFPEQAGRIHYQHYLVIWMSGGDELASLAALERSVAADPAFGPTLNALGYALVLRKEQLDRALGLIERAVQLEPNNGAYLDSLGWAYYKLGRFGQAVAWLERATAQEDGAYPVIYDHLGDAYWRAGQPEEAVGAWRRAQTLLAKGGWEGDAELVGLDVRLAQKLGAAASDGLPEVAPIAAEEPD
ncbi:tetratricopeptide repeat protein [Mucisphaera sp.]|uniref:tetratricopeptide repeat protein n=1 Tax=Mucisphaera sp. TaxID=2913024 RepID=UPI003D149764